MGIPKGRMQFFPLVAVHAALPHRRNNTRKQSRSLAAELLKNCIEYIRILKQNGYITNDMAMYAVPTPVLGHVRWQWADHNSDQADSIASDTSCRYNAH